MKLFGTIAVHVKGEELLRKPGLLDKLKKFFGGTPDLRTGKAKAALEATAVVDSVNDALRSISVNNAVALIVDDITLFHDKDGRPDDLGDLFLAFHEQSSALGGGFDMIRLTVEHVELGLHLVLEVQALSEHPVTDPAVRIIASGRLRELEPRPSETAEAYRARVEPLTQDKGALEVAKVQFESFVARVKDAIQRAMPEAKAEIVVAEARVTRPTPGKEEREQPPTSANYDPYMHYYPSPMGSLLSMMMWTSVFSMAMRPDIVVVNGDNTPTGHADDPGIEHADPGDHGDAGDAGDVGGDGYDAGDMGGDIGGGSDFGDFGGGDW